MVLLHGILDVTIHEGKDLPMSIANQATGFVKRVLCCNQLPELAGSVDPYVCLDVGSTRRLRSSICQSTNDPVWNERVEVYVADEAEELRIEVKDADIVGAEYMGQASIPVEMIIGGKLFDKWLKLEDQMGKPIGITEKVSRRWTPSKVRVSIKYIPVGSEESASLGLHEVPRVYFPQRPGNKVTLYHDSVCTPGPVPGIALAGGGLYSESSCWDDVYAAIQQAKRFIWITGWAVWHKTKLLRVPDRGEDSPSIGELLKQKAAEGVNVLMLVWDDTTNNMGLHSGLMATHDQETLEYFKGSEVTCLLCPRQGGMEETVLQKFSTGNMFTHHQKTIILDAPMQSSSTAAAAAAAGAAAAAAGAAAGPPACDPATLEHLSTPNSSPKKSGGKAGVFSSSEAAEPPRRVVAFIGGLDLTDGRYDRHDHPLFETLAEGHVHCGDLYQPSINAFDATKYCCRQPWHDIHAKVEGPAAMDICLNFMERWAKQAGTSNVAKMRHLDDHKDIHLPKGFEVFTSKASMLKSKLAHGGVTVKHETIRQQDPSLRLTDLPAGEDWSVQLFRSIDSDSAEGFPKGAGHSYDAGLTVGKGKSIEASIHSAYINLIRRAKRYLYLENQYFLGSAHLWDSDTDTPCYNQVPAEIALKIVSKIKAGEPFRVYIVTPLHPEGPPTAGSVQAILYFEAQTRNMMYKRVAAAIREAGLDAHPQDYLQFFCLGKREGYETSPGLMSWSSDLQPATSFKTMSSTKSGSFKLPADSAAGAAAGEAAECVGTNGVVLEQGPTCLPPADPANTVQGKCTASRRFMIYVHSKLMIVDDEYILLGSANINQRSLEGSRDSEICIGACQAGHTMASAAALLPRGQVAGFRKALWLEHIGALGPEHDDPSRLECMQALRATGDANWQAFMHPDVQPLPQGHLLNYPNSVGYDGSVGPLPDCLEFPDLGGKILGVKNAVLPGLLTT
ncbi:hypothetical protein OEZ85_008176 [Tetradesmus obliquus]|uniref:phospholipase D n=1 Tax=Tetradesmus obliquus TaxID=3088 RepID=A0ABY8TK43_TETOB|nr:hypothetical protein OEZ85_008176 [Tetradesmus obliquus]